MNDNRYCTVCGQEHACTYDQATICDQCCGVRAAWDASSAEIEELRAENKRLNLQVGEIEEESSMSVDRIKRLEELLNDWLCLKKFLIPSDPLVSLIEETERALDDASPEPEDTNPTFSEVQRRVETWVADHSPPMSKIEIIGGIAGEIGELAHAHRRTKQTRDGGSSDYPSEEDCIGDVVLFVIRYCIESGLEIAEFVHNEIWMEEIVSHPMTRDKDLIIALLVQALGDLSKACTKNGKDEEDYIEAIISLASQYCIVSNLDLAACVGGSLTEIEKRHYTKVDTDEEVSRMKGENKTLRLKVIELNETLESVRHFICEDCINPECELGEERTFDRGRLVEMLRNIYRNDKTRYEHHEPREWDGKTPDSSDGTTWLTPRDIAAHALRAIGEETPVDWG